MIQKLPVQIDEKLPLKNRVAIGWRVVKNIIQKCLTIGISLPKVAEEYVDEKFKIE
jgi:hypothetical protein